MNPTPTDIRQALARFPRWTQRFFTWLTAIALPGENRRWLWRPEHHIAALAAVWISASLAGALAGQRTLGLQPLLG